MPKENLHVAGAEVTSTKNDLSSQPRTKKQNRIQKKITEINSKESIFLVDLSSQRQILCLHQRNNKMLGHITQNQWIHFDIDVCMSQCLLQTKKEVNAKTTV